jgi:hypothetical protein
MSVPALALISSGVITAFLSQAAQSSIQWGVFDTTGNPALGNFDSVLEFTYSRRYDISTYPVQAGSFASYNKVIQPFEIELRFSASGTQQSRAAFLGRLEELVASTDLYAVVTPEISYTDCNPTHFDVHRRGGQGAYWLADVSLYLVQVLQSTPQYTTTAVNLPNAQNGASLPTSNVGTAYPYQPIGILLNSGNSAIGSVVPGTL